MTKHRRTPFKREPLSRTTKRISQKRSGAPRGLTEKEIKSFGITFEGLGKLKKKFKKK